MKLSFESNLSYQQEAIRAVVDLFEGQPRESSCVQYSLGGPQTSIIGSISNGWAPSEEQKLACTSIL